MRAPYTSILPKQWAQPLTWSIFIANLVRTCRFVGALSPPPDPHRAPESKGTVMPELIQPSDTGDPLGPLPQEFAAIMRPELPSLIKEIGVEVTRAYPEYARLLSGPNGQAIRVGVEQSLSSFVDLVAEPSASTSLRDDMCRRFGRFEAYEGRTMETLQGAYRLGARVALRRAKKVGRSYNFSPTLMLSFADALFAYIDELESLSREGFLEVVQSQTGEQTEAMRRRLLHLLLTGRPPPYRHRRALRTDRMDASRGSHPGRRPLPGHPGPGRGGPRRPGRSQ